MTSVGRGSRIASWTMLGLALGVAALTLRHHSWTASGADASGYVSQADLWRQGTLTIPQPLAAGAPWPDAEWVLSPLGYRPALTPGAIVPTYPAGLPLTLAAAQLIGGGDAAYVVVPLLAGVGIWLTFQLGRQIEGDVVGVIAAVLLAASPIYLRQSTQVMSDVPAAVWWTLSLLLAHRASRARSGVGAAFAAGLGGSLAIATRPNLAPLALAIAAALVSPPAVAPAVAGGASATGVRVRRLLALILGLAPGCLLIAWVHTHLYGSPLRSGYGSSEDLYALANVAENARLYAAWLIEGQTPLMLLALAASVLRTRRTVADSTIPIPGDTAGGRRLPLWPLWLLIALVVALYLPYAVFEAWWYIRFLLPAFPAALVLVAITVAGVASRTPARWRGVVLVGATTALVAMSVARARTLHTLDLAPDERRYAQVAAAIDKRVPRMSAFVSLQHSGSLHHYLGRPVLRWELLAPEALDPALDYLRAQGYRPYLLLDAGEDPRFRDRFDHASTMGRLDWPPLLELRSPTPVRLYDPDDRARYMAAGRIPTEIVFQPRR